MAEEKLKTAFPGLQQANGVKPENMEVVKPAEVSAGAPPIVAAPEKSNPGAGPSTNDTQPEPTAPAPKIDFSKLSDEDKAEMLSALTGGKIKSLDDLNPPAPKSKEELAAEAQKKSQDALTWALETGRVKKGDYEKAIVEKAKSNREIALSLFTAQVQEGDPAINDGEAEELFKFQYGEELEPTDRLYKLGQKSIDKIADAYRKDNFGSMDSIDTEYDNFVQTQSDFKSYKANVKKAVSELPKELAVSIPFKNIDGTEQTLEYKVPIDDKVISKLISDLSEERAFVLRKTYGEGKIDEKALTKEFNYHVKAMMYDKVLSEALVQNSKDVEERTLVMLGNKRNPQQSLNDGKQPLPNAPVKTNTYPSLNEAMRKNNLR